MPWHVLRSGCSRLGLSLRGHQVPYKNDSMGIMSIPFGAPGWGTGFIMVNAHYCLETTNCTLGGYHVDGKKRIQILSF